MTLDADFREAAPCAVPSVLHLVSRVTDSVFSFLGPATAALAQQGVRQTVVLIDDPACRHVLPKFHESVRLVLTSSRGDSADRMNGLLDAYCTAAAASPPAVAHLHGAVCSLLGAYAARSRGVSIPTYFSPHGSKLLGPMRLIGNSLLWALRPVIGGFGQRAIVSSGADARSLSHMVHRSIHLIESPVGDSFLQTHASPADTPQIVTAGRAPNPLGAAQFAQCAVVLGSQMPGLRFVWLGAVDAESSARLKAAGVEIRDLNHDAERATCLAGSWVYFAPAGDLGFPSFLSEALALGLPSVAWNTSYHRDVIEDGVTGYLCRDMREVLVRVAELLEVASTRQTIGSAARAQARLRFDGDRFRVALPGLYSAYAPTPTVSRRDGSDRRRQAASAKVMRRLKQATLDLRSVASEAVLTLVAAAAVWRIVRSKAAAPPVEVRRMSFQDAALLEGRYRATTSEDSSQIGSETCIATANLVVGWRGESAVGAAAIRWAGPPQPGERSLFPGCPEIHSVEVDATQRSTGVGTSLISDCEAWATERNFKHLGARVAVDNIHAYALYLRLGYVHIKTETVLEQAPALHPVNDTHFLMKALR